MKVIDIYGKEYKCSKCGNQVNYGGVEGPDGKSLTKDGKPFNNKFGKDSNKLSCAVDAGTVTIHGCYGDLVQRDYDVLIAGIPSTVTQVPDTQPSVVQADRHNYSTNPISEFEILWNKAYQGLSGLAAKVCEEGATARDKHITLCGILHDYFQFRTSKRI